MSDTAPGPGWWWQASDGRWYAPEQHPGHQPPPPLASPPGPYPGAPPYGSGRPYYVPVVVRHKTNGHAIASLVLSLVWMWGITSILAVIFGFVAKREIRESRGTQSGDGMATAGIVIGFVGVGAVMALITLLVVVGLTVHASVDSETRCASDAAMVETAAQAYHAQSGQWPPSVSALTQTINGQGPWLASVPDTADFTFFVSPADGTVYVYPPDSPPPASFSAANSVAAGGCGAVTTSP